MTSSCCLLTNEALSLAVAPLGAEMQYLRTGSGEDLLWHGDAAFWSGRAPVLFPIVGRAVDDLIAVGDHTAAMPQHGFARRQVFALEEQTETSCRHVLKESPESLVLYPFSFVLQVTHELDGNRLHVTAEVQNTDQRVMPFGFGFHPAFCWPLPKSDQKTHSISLASGGNPNRVGLQDGLLRPQPVAGPFSDGELELHEALFKDGALVFPNGAESLRYGPPDGPSLEFQFHNLPDLALWRPPGAPFLCIEPWHGTASYLGDGPKIVQRPNSIDLQPGAAVQFGYSVTVHV